MDEVTQSVMWEAHEHTHFEKGGDWYWVLWILALGGAIASFFWGNFLFSILILVAAGAMTLLAAKQPEIVPFGVMTRGVRLGDKLYPYSNLESYYINEEDPEGPQLLLKSKKFHMPLLAMPIPEEYIDEIEMLLRDRLPEEELQEPLAHKILEIFGF